jgi:hypothetical protein
MTTVYVSKLADMRVSYAEAINLIKLLYNKIEETKTFGWAKPRQFYCRLIINSIIYIIQLQLKSQNKATLAILYLSNFITAFAHFFVKHDPRKTTHSCYTISTIKKFTLQNREQYSSN